jgi:hypothetical protein
MEWTKITWPEAKLLHRLAAAEGLTISEYMRYILDR